MGTRQKPGVNESFSENNRVGESFNFRSDGTNNVWNENYVFRAEDNRITSTNDIGNTGAEENDAAASRLNGQKTTIDNNDSNKRNNNNNSNNSGTEEEIASEGAASSSAVSTTSGAASGGASAGGVAASSAVSTIASVATTAVVIVVGGSIVVNGTAAVDPPKIIEFEQIEADENTISFTLLLGEDYETINSEEPQKDCTIAVELTCEQYRDFRQTIEVNNYGRIAGTFSDLRSNTEYTIDVYQRNLLDIETNYLIDPIKITTITGIVAPTSFAINPSSARAVVGGDPLQLSLTNIQPANADVSVTWSSSNTSLVTVDSSGLVRGIAESDEPTTITATSTINPSVTATATIYTSAQYVPTFDKVTDPFDDSQIYMMFDVINDSREYDYYTLDLIKLIRETGEEDPDAGRPYFPDFTNIKQRQLLESREESIDSSALYKVRLVGVVNEYSDDPMVSEPIGETEYNLYEGTQDFATIKETCIGDGTGYTNQLFLKRYTVYNSDYVTIQDFSYFEAYVDAPKVDNIVSGDGTAVAEADQTLYVGVFDQSEENPVFGGNDGNQLTYFTLGTAGEIQRVTNSEFDVSNIDEYTQYQYIVYRVTDGRTYEAITEPQMFVLSVLESSGSMEPFLYEDSLSVVVGKSDLLETENARISIDIGSNYLCNLEPAEWSITLYEGTGWDKTVVQSGLTFNVLQGFSGFYGRYIYELTSSEETLWYAMFPESADDCKTYTFSIVDQMGNTYWDIPYTSTLEHDYIDGAVIFGLYYDSQSAQVVESTMTATICMTDLLFQKYESVFLSGTIAEDIDTEHEFEMELSINTIRTEIDIIDKATNEQLVVNKRDLSQLNIYFEVLGYIYGEEEPVIIYSEWIQHWS